MKYFISLRLSHNSVSVAHYRDDDGIERLLPFRGCDRPIPLAVSVINNTINVGATALEHYEKHLPNSFFRLFSLLKGNETYQRFGGNHPANTLIYVAIETILDNLLQNEFGNRIADIRAELPIGFDFAPDVTTDERKQVLDLFKNGYPGECERYGNIGIFDTNKIIANTALENNFRRYCMVLDYNSGDINASLYSKDAQDCINSRIFAGLGLDPRIAAGVNCIKQQIQAYNPFIDFSPVEDRLQQIIVDFIDSNSPENAGDIRINDDRYDYFISKYDISNTGHTHSQNVITDIRSLAYATGGIHLNDITFVIRNKALQTDYFMSIFRGEMDSVSIVDDKSQESLDAFIINDMVASGWTLDPYRRLKIELDNEYAELKQHIECVLIPKRNFDRAIMELEDYASRTSKVDYHEHDDHIRLFISQLKDLEIKQEQDKENNTASEPPRKEPPRFVRPTPRDERQEQQPDVLSGWRAMVNATRAQVSEFIDSGMISEARQEINLLRDNLREEGIHDFDNDIRAMLAMLPTTPRGGGNKPTDNSGRYTPQNNGSNSGSTPPPPPRNTSSPADEAIARRDYTAAKKIYNDLDDLDRAILMGKLAKAHRQYEVAASCFDAYVAEGNTRGIERVIRELEAYLDLLREAGIKDTDVEALHRKYKEQQ